MEPSGQETEIDKEDRKKDLKVVERNKDNRIPLIIIAYLLSA